MSHPKPTSAAAVDQQLDFQGLAISAPAKADKLPSAGRKEHVETLKNLSARSKEALDQFEKGVKKESNGSMSDAIEFYRKAFKLDEKVEQLYRAKIYSQIPDTVTRKGAEVPNRRLDEKAISKINVRQLLSSFAHEPIHKADEDAPNLLQDLPDDVVHAILETLIHIDTPSFVAFSMTCKRMAYLGLGTSFCWKVLCEAVYKYQNYDEEVSRLNGISEDQTKMVVAYDHNWHKMYSERPFIKFNGLYISVVNYYREGGRPEGSSSWNNPIRMITYYRYIRFFKDGTCMKLLTVEEPPNVVSKFTRNWKENGLSKIYRGYWTISPDGQVSVGTDGSVDRYKFVENLQIKSSHRHRHTKLHWINYEFMDIETTETNYFDIKKEKAYVFSRVKSYKDDE